MEHGSGSVEDDSKRLEDSIKFYSIKKNKSTTCFLKFTIESNGFCSNNITTLGVPGHS